MLLDEQTEIATAKLHSWFAARGWAPAPFQIRAWQESLRGRQGLIQVPTGSGKTYAAFGGPLIRMLADGVKQGDGLQVVYITPLRALARDIEHALLNIIHGVGLDIAVESRTGDTPEKIKAKQRKRLPEVLIITPESLALLLARPESGSQLSGVKSVIVDEWHELLGSKRGVQVQLNLSRCRAYSPALKTWGMSATLGNISHALAALMPVTEQGVLVECDIKRPIVLETVLPEVIDPFPWAGHMGLSMLSGVIDAINPEESNLIFTNTRRQAESWFQALKDAKPEWQDILALHHGSLSLENRQDIESGLKDGRLRVVVATSSLDLGVDFPYVERVFQIGSPKAVARLTQRAGRSAHRPGATARVSCVPANTFEILEFVAARSALGSGKMEERYSPVQCIDVLIQHLVTLAIGGGFRAEEVLGEIRSVFAFRELPDEVFTWCLQFVVNGGNVLDAYPAYKKVEVNDGFYFLKERRLASIHRLNIGTITSDEQIAVKMVRGGRLGYVDESYIERLRKGDRFVFAGRTLEYLSLYELTATVRAAGGKNADIPAFQGKIFPLSMPLGQEMRLLLSALKAGEFPHELPESEALATICGKQSAISVLPDAGEYLFEMWNDRRESFLFCYPFCGRDLHEGLASVLALRLSMLEKASFAISANDYGFLICRTGELFDFTRHLEPGLFTKENLLEDLARCIDTGHAAKRKFREMARIAGLVPQKYPGRQRKGGRAMHLSSSLLYSTLERFDPGNLLVGAAKEAAINEYTDGGRLGALMDKVAAAGWCFSRIDRPSPLSFPLLVERVRARIGSESLAERVAKIREEWILSDAGSSRSAGRGRKGKERASLDDRA